MNEYDIENVTTGEKQIIFGYTLADAFRRSPSLNPDEWECTFWQFVD